MNLGSIPLELLVFSVGLHKRIDPPLVHPAEFCWTSTTKREGQGEQSVTLDAAVESSSHPFMTQPLGSGATTQRGQRLAALEAPSLRKVRIFASSSWQNPSLTLLSILALITPKTPSSFLIGTANTAENHLRVRSNSSQLRFRQSGLSARRIRFHSSCPTLRTAGSARFQASVS